MAWDYCESCRYYDFNDPRFKGDLSECWCPIWKGGSYVPGRSKGCPEHKSRYVSTFILNMNNNKPYINIRQGMEKLIGKIGKEHKLYEETFVNYEVVGPRIVKELNKEKNNIELMDEIFNTVIKTVELVNDDEVVPAYNLYFGMINELDERYSITENIIEESKFNDIVAEEKTKNQNISEYVFDLLEISEDDENRNKLNSMFEQIEKDDDYKDTLDHYNEVGPKIVKSMKDDLELEMVMVDVMDSINIVSLAINNEDYYSAIKFYFGMVNSLEERYNNKVLENK